MLGTLKTVTLHPSDCKQSEAPFFPDSEEVAAVGCATSQFESEPVAAYGSLFSFQNVALARLNLILFICVASGALGILTA